MDFEDDTAALAGRTSLAFLQAVYCNDGLPLHVRMKAAIAALPFEHPKLSATLAVQADDSWAAKLQAAIERSRQSEAYRAAIEHQPTAAPNGHGVYDTAQAVSAAAVRTPLVSYRRR
jgi:hypothetical protein